MHGNSLWKYTEGGDKTSQYSYLVRIVSNWVPDKWVYWLLISLFYWISLFLACSDFLACASVFHFFSRDFRGLVQLTLRPEMITQIIRKPFSCVNKQSACNWKFNFQNKFLCNWRTHRKYLMEAPELHKTIPARKPCVADIPCNLNIIPPIMKIFVCNRFGPHSTCFGGFFAFTRKTMKARSCLALQIADRSSSLPNQHINFVLPP